jgi:formylglycine-generating enzyme required for sulfatase activity
MALALALLLFASDGFAEEATDFIHQGDKAVAMKDWPTAAESFAKALALDPGHYRVMKSLAEVDIILRKYPEADALIGKIMAMPVLTGKQVIVTLQGEAEPLEAELVDETVVAPFTGQNNMRNYLDVKPLEPIPHYRLFFKKSGELKLIPKVLAKIKYLGVSRRDRELVEDMQTQVKNKLMLAAAPTTLPEDEMVAIKGGCFKMGTDKGDDDEGPAHEVCVSDFKMGKHEVTQRSFQARMKSNPAQTIGADLPADSVTWFEAVEYCTTQGKRLPTEAEWEYAARGGTQTEYYTGDSMTGKQANFCDKNCTLNIRDEKADDGYALTAKPGSFPPNPFGLYDMAGNLAEWVSDWMLENYYRQSPKKNPQGPKIGDYKVVRGGSWETKVDMLRSTSRYSLMPDYRMIGFGFRCAQ